ncbi:MAG: hypothetical protein F4Z00_00190 [Acidimicrobiaceae bacterium]|nr:hypothetical protein [Acidimicrobiaceae bacterium]MXZ63961.1 hypothetical protein [Acidimicrobiaceae bacterium]MYF31976.1 hypothetical protein [Acidimicrobiaceae bacterium]MYG76952.1 hypothetical protein [Acidimicrobiaceae bacterium]MYJ84419.1 hypothetical protein [Acidimicrobiaceae bacterium]
MTLEPEIERHEPTRIHLLWRGPHTFGDVLEMVGKTDFGIYQVYGPHPASGTDSLLYIGQANDQTFGERFTNHDRREWSPDPWGDNTMLLRFFTGRVHLTQHEQDRGAIDDELWGTYIDMAERLLICVHAPHWNAQGVQGINQEQTGDFDDCHVLNWGTRGSLLPEVSGARHAWKEFERICDDPLEWTTSQAN